MMGSCVWTVVLELELALAIGRRARGQKMTRRKMRTPNPMEDGLVCCCCCCFLRAMVMAGGLRFWGLVGTKRRLLWFVLFVHSSYEGVERG